MIAEMEQWNNQCTSVQPYSSVEVTVELFSVGFGRSTGFAVFSASQNEEQER
jgi:hypothetical protein